jgi:hypothetical protein
MSPEETRRYVTGRIDYGAADAALRERFDDDRVAWLHRESGGNPRRLQGLASWLVHRDGLAPDAIAPWVEGSAGPGGVPEDIPALDVDDEDVPVEAPSALVDNATAGS